MGHDKATLVLNGKVGAQRIADALARVVSPVIEVGPGTSGADWVLETERGEGPLMAIEAGARALRARAHRGASLVVACDLPFVDESVFEMLARWPGIGSVVPMVNERAQPLCARWSPSDLGAVPALIAAGERSLRGLLARPDVALIDEATWRRSLPERAFADVDTPEDLKRLGLRWHPTA
jgi:molybdenum cofactor guanylyltransferase